VDSGRSAHICLLEPASFHHFLNFKPLFIKPTTKTTMSTKPTDTKILIIGAGLGGLTLAAICRRAGLPCIVLERTEKLSPAGAGISLAPNALRVLDQLGVYSRVKENGQRLNTMLVHYEKDHWRSLDFTGLESKFGYPVYSIERHSFHEYLYDAAGGPENVRLSSKVVDVVDEYGSPKVVVKVADGTTYTADVVVGADGIRSVTRRILAQNAGLDSINTIQFTGRVHMSGYTKPIPGLGKEHLGVGNWIFYDDAILTTWPCKDNRQWYIGVKVRPEHAFSYMKRY
jgi:salicylate hydroxylase